MSTPLETWELELLDLFVDMFDLFGVPKSTAQIYGILYCAEEGMMQEEIISRLGISTGSASQGLRTLTGMGAVQRQSVPGQRQSLFVPERSMRRLATHMMDAQLRPRLISGKSRLEQILDQVPEEKDQARDKIHSLLTWQRKAERAMPMISVLLNREKKGSAE